MLSSYFWLRSLFLRAVYFWRIAFFVGYDGGGGGDVVLLLLFNWVPCAFCFYGIRLYCYLLLFIHLFVRKYMCVCVCVVSVSFSDLSSQHIQFADGLMMNCLNGWNAGGSSLSFHFSSYRLYSPTSLCIHKIHFRMVYVLKIETVWLSSISMPMPMPVSLSRTLTTMVRTHCNQIHSSTIKWANIHTSRIHRPYLSI